MYPAGYFADWTNGDMLPGPAFFVNFSWNCALLWITHGYLLRVGACGCRISCQPRVSATLPSLPEFRPNLSGCRDRSQPKANHVAVCVAVCGPNESCPNHKSYTIMCCFVRLWDFIFRFVVLLESWQNVDWKCMDQLMPPCLYGANALCPQPQKYCVKDGVPCPVTRKSLVWFTLVFRVYGKCQLK